MKLIEYSTQSNTKSQAILFTLYENNLLQKLSLKVRFLRL